MNRKLILMSLLVTWITSCTTIPKYMSKEEYKALGDGLYAHMETSKGNMLIRLHEDKAPITVANFVGLTEGKMKNSAKEIGVPFYDGIIFHRVIKDFMIQGGDPQGSGMGGPGYQFEDEFDDSLKHDKKGILSMANSGPATNGSQFFITEVPTPWLDGRHTVFGEVIDGLEVVNTIAEVEKGAQDRPVEEVKIIKMEILRKGDKYKDYNPVISFEQGKKNHAAKLEAAENKLAEARKADANRLKSLAEKAEITDSGLRYVILKEGKAAKPENGDPIKVHYTLRLANGEKVDSSLDRNQPLDVVVGQTQLIQGWMEALTLFNRGTEVLLIIPPTLGYGERGAGGVIPPNATLYFDMEVLE